MQINAASQGGQGQQDLIGKVEKGAGGRRDLPYVRLEGSETQLVEQSDAAGGLEASGLDGTPVHNHQ